MASEPTAPFVLAFKVSRVPSAFSRAMQLRVTPPMVLNVPPITIFPSAWIAMALTAPFALGSNKVSRLPSAFRRAMRLRGVPPMVVNVPPIMIFPSACTAMALT